MFFTEIILLAGIFALDALLIAFSYGLTTSKLKLTEGLKLSVMMGGFQFLMPILGYFFFKSASLVLSGYAKTLDHWIVFIIFLILGGKIIYESFQSEEKTSSLSWLTLILLSLATSIDAFAGGVLILTQDFPILTSALIIGIVTCFLVGLGYILSAFFSRLPKIWLEIGGGILLILLGAKVLLEHTL